MFVFWAVYYSIELTFCSDPEKVSIILNRPATGEDSQRSPLQTDETNTENNVQ